MTQNRSLWLLLAGLMVITACKAEPTQLKKKVGQPMDPYIHLYQFTRAGNPISVARIIQVRIHPDPQTSTETVEVGVEIMEAMWGEPGANRRNYEFQRPSSQTAQVKFPDPIWGRVSVREGANILLVAATASVQDSSSLVYVDEVVNLDDPVLNSIRTVLKTERSVRDRNQLFEKRLDLLRAGTVEKLFAGEALASAEPFRPEENARVGEVFPRAFREEKDVYVKISLGTWLWERVYPRASLTARVNTLNATIEAADSASESVRIFALDRLAEVDPRELRGQIKASKEVIRLLEDRRTQEEDADVRRHLEEIIAALRNGVQN